MNKEMTPVLKSWQFFLSCRRILGDGFMATLYNRGTRQLYRWSADPDFTSPNGYERNPIDRMKTLLERLHEKGRTEIARSALSILSNAIGYEITPIIQNTPDQPTIEAEMLDDYPALIRFHEAIRGGEAQESIQHWGSEAKREIDETLCKCRADNS